MRVTCPQDRRERRWDYALCVLLALILAERIWVFFELGAQYMSNSDDMAYVESGIRFAKTGIISMWSQYPTAMIMPGMPVLMGCFSLIFGEGTGLITALKMLWIAMGVLTAYFAYKTVVIFTPKCFGLFAAGCFLIPNMAWINNVLLTETPYTLFLTACIYFTLQMGQRDRTEDFVGYTLCFMLALMFRANIISMPVFTGIYLLSKKSLPRRRLLKHCAAFVCVLLVFVIPWGLRNYAHFGAFIPLSYGEGNPLLLGSYQGEGYPADEELDYYSQVHLKMREDYPQYYGAEPESAERVNKNRAAQEYDPYGDIEDESMAQYLALQEDGVKARYRLKEWFANDPVSFLKSYLIIKPRWMLNWAWAWEEVLSTPYQTLHLLSQINLVLCAITAALSLLLKKCRRPVLFL